MKRLLFPLFFCFFCAQGYGQRLNTGVQLDTLSNSRYISIYCSNINLFKGDVSYNIDYGADAKMFSKTYLVDHAQEKLTFNSPVTLLNYLAGYGWELVSSSTTDEVGVTHIFWLRREKK